MSDFSLFLKKNKVKKENIKKAVTKSLKGEDGQPLLWEIRAVGTREDEELRDACTREDAQGKMRLDVNRYIAKLAAAAVVYPDLYDAVLQDSYGVMSPEDLIREMIDDPREYREFTVFVRAFGETDVTMSERIEEAKN